MDGGDPNWASKNSAFEIYVHEIGHSIDAGHRFTDLKEWQKAWKENIVGGKMLLSRVALKLPSEAFADFYRYILVSGDQLARENFPSCYKFLQNKNLI